MLSLNNLCLIAVLSSWFGVGRPNCAGNRQLTERFGKLNFNQLLRGTVERCSWTFNMPDEDAVLVARFEYSRRRRRCNGRGGGGRFENGIFDGFSQIRLPGGEEINRRSISNLPLTECRKYYHSARSSACTDQFLNNYCLGANYQATQWPPTIGVHQDTEYYIYFDLKMFYIVVPCSQRISSFIPLTKTSTTTKNQNTTFTPRSSTIAVKESRSTPTEKVSINRKKSKDKAILNQKEKSDKQFPASSSPTYASWCWLLVPVLGTVSCSLLVILFFTIVITTCKIRRLKRESRIQDLPKTNSNKNASCDQAGYLQPINVSAATRVHPPLPQRPHETDAFEYEDITEKTAI